MWKKWFARKKLVSTGNNIGKCELKTTIDWQTIYDKLRIAISFSDSCKIQIIKNSSEWTHNLLNELFLKNPNVNDFDKVFEF